MKILVVDDEPEIRALCRHVLELAGHEIGTAASGEEAVKHLDEGWEIVLTDLMMPGSVDGIELIRRTRESSNADVLLMTAYPGLESAITALKRGAFDYILKPFTLDALLQAVNRCIEKRLLSLELARERELRTELDQAYTALRQMERVRETFGRFVTPEVAEYVLAHPEDYWHRGESRTVTVLFMDVRGFTSFSASVVPTEVVEVLNDIFLLVVDAIQREGGILNKFLGDGLMALFGIPLPNKEHARAAARVALRARDAVEALCELRRSAGLQPLRIGIGVNTGEVIAGCVGTKDRTEYSVIGHAVNVAARLEQMAAPGQILVGPETIKDIQGAFEVSGTLTLKLPGLPEPVPVAELLGETLKEKG